MTEPHSRAGAISSYERAKILLSPVVTLLHAMGLTQSDARRIFSSLYEARLGRRNARQMKTIEDTIQHYADIVTRWMTDSKFTDKTGRPRVLPLRGANSFHALVKKVNSQANPDIVLSVFTRYNTVRRVNKGSYALVKPFFCIDNDSNLAFEPFECFLADASSTLNEIFIRTKINTDGPFWRKVENRSISKAVEKEFMVFSRKRSQVFLEELDEWLSAHSQKYKHGAQRKTRRVGLGLFSVSSDIKDW